MKKTAPYTEVEFNDELDRLFWTGKPLVTICENPRCPLDVGYLHERLPELEKKWKELREEFENDYIKRFGGLGQ